MIHRPHALATTERLRELPRGSENDFPHIAIAADLEHYADRCSSWHWHEYFEFALVLGGDMELSTPRQTLLLRDGSGYFVNSNVLHLCRVADGSAQARLHVHQFGRGLIANSALVSRRYLQPVETCAELDALPLLPDNPVHREILSELRAAFEDAEQEAADYALSISRRMLRAWQLLYGCTAEITGRSTSFGTDEASRIKQMLSYIHSHYAEAISVPMIAAAANICPRECFRCFRQTLGTTPTLYLMRHRVNTAARLLTDSDMSITDIALGCGFSSPSYFCKVFRSLIGQAPRDFRSGH